RERGLYHRQKRLTETRSRLPDHKYILCLSVLLTFRALACFHIAIAPKTSSQNGHQIVPALAQFSSIGLVNREPEKHLPVQHLFVSASYRHHFQLITPQFLRYLFQNSHLSALFFHTLTLVNTEH